MCSRGRRSGSVASRTTLAHAEPDVIDRSGGPLPDGAAGARRREEGSMTLFDLWLVIVTLLFFIVNVVYAIGCDRLRETRR